MYECRIQAGFSASHQVRMYDDQLEPLHGHDWKVEAVYRGPELDRIGVLIDFVAVQRELAAIVDRLHHTHLNDNPFLGGDNPTAEHVARRIFDALTAAIPGTPLAGVYVTEAPGCIAGYCPADR